MRFVKHSPFFNFLYVFLFVMMVSQVSYSQVCIQIFTPATLPATYIAENGMVVCVSGAGNISGEALATIYQEA